MLSLNMACVSFCGCVRLLRNDQTLMIQLDGFFRLTDKVFIVLGVDFIGSKYTAH